MPTTKTSSPDMTREDNHTTTVALLDGFAQRVLQVFADAEGMLVGVLIEAFEEAVALHRREAVLMQQGGTCLQRICILSVQDVGPVEA